MNGRLNATHRIVWMSVGVLRWYLVRTKPSREAVAQTNLERQGFEVYCPRLTESSGNLLTERVTALFPGYLFLQLAEGSQSLRPVQSTIGVANVVRFGLQYTVVPEAVIRGLRMRADPVTGMHRLTGPPMLTVGASVRVCAGAFEGFEGIFQRPSGVDRVVVLLRLLGHDAAVRVPARYVHPRVGT